VIALLAGASDRQLDLAHEMAAYISPRPGFTQHTLTVHAAAHCMVLLLIALFYHTALGLQVVIEDYIHSGAKAALLVAVRLGCFALATAGIVATLRIAIRS